MKQTNGTKLWQRILLGVLSVAMMALAVLAGLDGLTALREQNTETEIEYFDSYTDNGKEALLYFNLISDSFATFTIGESHDFYFALDSNEHGIFPYIICMPADDLSNYQEIYDYTFSPDADAAPPEYADITGYPMAIDDDLKELAIEYFNFFWDEEVLTEENFSEIVGDYYLDTTYQPESGDGVEDLLVAGVLFVLGCVLLFVALKKNKQPNRLPTDAAPADVAPTDASESTELPLTESPAEIAPPLNHGLGLIGAVGGALIGGILWIVLYRAGYIAGLAGYLAVFCAMKGYHKFAGGTSRAGTILSTVIAIVTIILCHGIALAWVIAVEVNALNPGRATIGYILSHFGEMMDLLELWGSFWLDLLIGLALGIVASIGPISAAIKQEKKTPQP